MSVGHSGISIYATGVDSASTQLSNEVLSGYSGTPQNIKFTEGSLEVYLKEGRDIQNFNLFKYIVDANNGSDDLYYFNSVELLQYSMVKSYLEDIDFLLTTDKQIIEKLTEIIFNLITLSMCFLLAKQIFNLHQALKKRYILVILKILAGV